MSLRTDSVARPTVDFDFAGFTRQTRTRLTPMPLLTVKPVTKWTRFETARVIEEERTVVLLKVYDRKSFRQIAAEVGKSAAWVAATLKRVQNRKPSVTGATSLSQAVQERRERESKNLMRETTLTDAMNHAHDVLSRWPHGTKVDAGHISSALDELGISATANEKQGRVALVAIKPEILWSQKAGHLSRHLLNFSLPHATARKQRRYRQGKFSRCLSAPHPAIVVPFLTEFWRFNPTRFVLRSMIFKGRGANSPRADSGAFGRHPRNDWQWP